MTSSWWLDSIGRYPLLTAAQEVEMGTAIQAWRNHPEPCPPGIRRRGQRARDRFVQSNLRLVIYYVTKRCHRLTKQHSEDDLIQAGNEGLIKAVEKFDPTRGYKFSTYAYWWIRQSVNLYCERHSRTVAIPASHHQHLGRMSWAISDFLAKHGRHPSCSELAKAMGLSEKVLEQVVANGQPVSSLDIQVADEMDLADILPAHDVPIEEQEEQEWMIDLIDQLPKNDRLLVVLAYGLEGEPQTLAQVAQACGISWRAAKARLRMVEQMLRLMAQSARQPAPDSLSGVVEISSQLTLF